MTASANILRTGETTSPIERLIQCSSIIEEGGLYLAKVPIEAFLTARKLTRQELNKADHPAEGAQGAVFHALQNLLWRIDEQTEGMLVTFTAGCPAAAETIARAVVEASINLIYIISGDRGKRLVNFFRLYLKEHRKRLDEWEMHILSSAHLRQKSWP